MKQKKCRGFLFAMLGCLMLTGCGDAPYELTEEEQQLIVSYSAHVVSKFNTFQKDGLTYVPELDDELVESTDTQEPPEVETEAQEGNSEIPQGGGSSVPNAGTEQPGEEATMSSAFSDLGLTITYLGNEVTASYIEDNTYAVNAGMGKKLLVLKFKVENTTETMIAIDNMAASDEYSAKYMMESGKSYNAKAVMTLLLSDFTTYEGTIEPQEAKEMVIVFEIPEETTSVEAVHLKVQRNGTSFQINL